MIDQTLETINPSPEPYLRFSLFLSYQGKTVRNLNTKKFGRLLYLINNREWDRAHVIVKYFETGMINEGTYTNVDDLKAALDAFREKELLEYVGNYEIN